MLRQNVLTAASVDPLAKPPLAMTAFRHAWASGWKPVERGRNRLGDMGIEVQPSEGNWGTA
jgi:hypothetical protein